MSTPIGPNNQKSVKGLPRQKPIIPPINTLLLNMPLVGDRIFQKGNESLPKSDLLVGEIRESNKEISAKLSKLIEEMKDFKQAIEKTAEEWKKTLGESNSQSSK